jgi:hypothetical protein
VIDGKIACVWAATLNDEAIWRKRPKRWNLYSPYCLCSSQRIILLKIVEWAKGFRGTIGEYVRLDTGITFDCGYLR